MEESMASLEISPPLAERSFQGFVPYSKERFDFDAAFKRFNELSAKLESFIKFPYNVPQNRDYFPGRDCYRLNTDHLRRQIMALYYPKALAYFNNKYNTDYKFEDYVELTLSGMDHNYAAHCNFIAKPESAPFKPGDFSHKLFFAEFMDTAASNSSLTFCCMLDGTEADCKSGCSMCPQGVISHPISFRSGCKLPLE